MKCIIFSRIKILISLHYSNSLFVKDIILTYNDIVNEFEFISYKKNFDIIIIL